MNCRLLVVIITIIGLFKFSWAQQYNVYTFNEQEGLSNTLIKAVIQDSAGFIWSATDGGILMFNGRSFVPILEGLPSIYTKNIYLTSSNKLIALTDLGAGYIKNHLGNWHYQAWIDGNPASTNSTLCYPKEIFEDSKHRIWISDQNSVNLAVGSRIKKYRFDDKFKTDSYFRSFLFTEDKKGNLFVSSWKGALFVYDQNADSFRQLAFRNDTRPLYINQLMAIDSDKLMLATDQGLLQLKYSKGLEVLQLTKLVNIPSLSSFLINTDNTVLLGTWNSGVKIWDPKTSTISDINFSKSNTVNRMIFDHQGDIWVATDEGLVLLKRTVFATADYLKGGITPPTRYIRNVVKDETGTVYFSDQDKIYKVQKKPNGFTYSQIYDSRPARIYSFAMHEGVLWVQHRDGTLIRRFANRIQLLPNIYKFGRIASLKVDSRGNVWGFLEQNNTMIKIRPDLTTESYPFPPESNYSQQLAIDSEDNIYFIYSDHEFHIFIHSPNSAGFEEVKISNHPHFSDMVSISAFLVQRPGSGLIGSSNGLFEMQNERIENRTLDKSIQSNIYRAISLDNQGHAWLATDRELILEVNGNYIQYTQKDGLPAASATPGGLVVDNDNRLWVGTPAGMGYYKNDSLIIKPTPKPIILALNVNYHNMPLSSAPLMISGTSDLKFIYTCLSYPRRIIYQTRMLGLQQQWSDFTFNNEADFYNLPPGNYILEIRGRQAGHLWSSTCSFPFQIVPRWYATWYMKIIYILLLAGIITGLVLFYQKRKVQRYENENKWLEELVNEKTRYLQEEKALTDQLLNETRHAKAELERINKDLQKANGLKNDLLSITSHDLKNPLSTIMGFSEVLESEDLTPDEIKKVHYMIHQSSIRMYRIITELLDSFMLESTDFKLEKSHVDLTDLIKKVLSFYEGQVKLKQQNMILQFDKPVMAFVDPKWFAEAIDNLISNAVKYSPYEKDIIVTLSEKDGFAIITIKDEGPGFTEADKQYLFQKFKRLSARPTAGESSMGLGLSIVKEIIHLHGGDIRLESQSGNGSTFFVRIHQ